MLQERLLLVVQGAVSADTVNSYCTSRISLLLLLLETYRTSDVPTAHRGSKSRARTAGDPLV